VLEFHLYRRRKRGAWLSSVAYQLYPYIKNGVAVAFEYSKETKHSIPYGTTVYVENIDVWYSDNMAIRYLR